MNNPISISDARAKLPQLVNKVDAEYERVTITVNGKPKAVLISAEEVEALEETAEILAIPGALKEIKEGLKQIKQGKGIPLSSLK